MLTDDRILELMSYRLDPETRQATKGYDIQSFARAIEAEVRGESEPVAEVFNSGIMPLVEVAVGTKLYTTPQPCPKCANVCKELKEIHSTLDDVRVDLTITASEAIKELQAKCAELEDKYDESIEVDVIPETRTKNLMKLLGWQGGTIHDACKEIGLDVHDFLYGNADFNDNGPCHDFQRGYEEAEDVAVYLSSNRGNLQYWLGAISSVQNTLAAKG